uniref:Uncharacterized protein TCIL3000_6_2140 n=1 Tax=Trypanosoma congolense (strain IL3000) TaxID=1068625 RepID=G0UNL4_TRYCI|nr:unnamed protein product [Trypanosoma congolense IL3000]
MVPAITFRHCVPTATAALTAHLMADGRNVFVSSTLTVDFTYVTSSNSSDKTMEPAAELSREPEKVESFPVLLLALSPLHKIQRVRVMSSKKSGENMVQGDECNPSTDGASMEWQDVELNEETLTPVDGSVLRMISRGGAKQGVASYTAQDGCPQDVTPCKRRHSTGNDTFSDDGSDVLELVFSSSDSGDDKAPNEPSCVPELCQDGEEFVRCFTLKLLPPTTDAFGAVDGEFHSVHRCSVDIVLLPSEELAHVSYPQMFVSSLCDTVRPTSNTFQNSEADEVVCWDESSYVLLVGQRMYDCFICPRLAYADKIIPCVGYSSVDVNITAISLLENDDSKKWTAVSFSPLPLRPENLLCAFVQTKVATNSRCNVEIHGGVKWHVRYSAAFVHMAAADSGEAAVGPALPDMYFFGCDHANFQHILHMEKVAEAAWTAAVHCVTEDYPRTWVVSHTYEVNTLLGLRRGVLCTDRAALLFIGHVACECGWWCFEFSRYFFAWKNCHVERFVEMSGRAAGALCQNVPEFMKHGILIALLQ